jgi:catechol 2,3-dioxygenase-like lactoylglutathione lyase family enzyme
MHPAMPIASLDHLVLTVADLGRTVSFYEALGMRLERFGDGRIALRFGDQKLNLHEARHEFEPKAERPTPGSADVCFLVTEASIEDTLAGLAAAGIGVELGPVRRTGATGALTSVYVRDPDRNLVELSVPAADAGSPS